MLKSYSGGKSMKRYFISMFIAILFLIVPVASSLKTIQNGTGYTTPMNVINGKNYDSLKTHEVLINREDVISLTNEILGFKEWIYKTRPFLDFEFSEVEKNQIKAKLDNIVNPLNVIFKENDIEPITTNWLFKEMFETEFGGSTIISIGVGYAFIPFYEYEMLFGSIVRPIWLIYLPIVLGNGGYTGNLNINLFPFRFEYCDRFGAHIVRTTFFTGLYLNIGDLGYDTLLGGVMIMLGRARVVM
jgi:hypothetical protein